ncbi:MAG: alanine--tRNA ligase-related protein [Candidatus Caldatribacteriaceae bacterium]
MTLETMVSRVRREKEKLGLSFPQTVFFPEGGGQLADRGVIRGERWWMQVEEVKEEDREIWHWGTVEGQEPEPGEPVILTVDETWRRMMCEQHTAQHLFSAVLERDYALPTTGFSIFTDWTKIEVPCQDRLSPALLGDAEDKVCMFIHERLPVHVYWEDACTRIVEIPGLDRNPCGGLHVKDTGYIGCFAVLRFYRKNRAFWRIEFVAGRKLEKTFREGITTIDALRTILGNDPIEGARHLMEKTENLEEKVRVLQEELNDVRSLLLENQAEIKGGGKTIVRCLPYGFEEMRMIARKLQERGVSSLFYNDRGQLVSCALSPSWGEKVMALLAECGFRGTRAPHFAQGKIENILQSRSLLKKM